MVKCLSYLVFSVFPFFGIFDSIHFLPQTLLVDVLMRCHINMQQVPEEIERVIVGIEAYLSIRRHASESGLSFFEDDGESEKENKNKVHFRTN